MFNRQAKFNQVPFNRPAIILSLATLIMTPTGSGRMVFLGGGEGRIATVAEAIGFMIRHYRDNVLHRIYYGTDSQKLYINLGDHWEFIATLRHGLLGELNEDTHLQYFNSVRHQAPGAHSHLLRKLSGSQLPVVSEELRGELFVLLGTAGVADRVFVCIRNSSHALVWREISLL